MQHRNACKIKNGHQNEDDLKIEGDLKNENKLKIEDNHKTKEALKIKMTSSPMPRLTMTILACLCYSEVLLFAGPKDNSCTMSTGICCPMGGQGCGGVSSFAEEG